MSVTSPAKSQVIAIENVPRPQYSYAALAFMQITAGGSAGNFVCFCVCTLLQCCCRRVWWRAKLGANEHWHKMRPSPGCDVISRELNIICREYR